MKALVLAPLSYDALSRLDQLVTVEYESWTDTRRLYDPIELADRLNNDETAILVIEADFIFEEVFAESKDLRFLGVCRRSLSHIDLEAATKHGVLVVNTPGRNARAVAELAIGLMLSLARHIPSSDHYVKQGLWEGPVEAYISHNGIELQGKVLGLIGFGAVGRIVSKLARAFGMEVLAYDPYVGHIGERRAGALLCSLEDVLTRSLFISLHTTLSSETTGLLGKREFVLMKNGSYLINTAAHELVDENALVRHLGEHRLNGAALDVHQAHPIPPSSPLLKLNNVILTPHIGGATLETVERHSTMIVDDIARFIAGIRPRRLANPKAWRNYGR